MFTGFVFFVGVKIQGVQKYTEIQKLANRWGHMRPKHKVIHPDFGGNLFALPMWQHLALCCTGRTGWSAFLVNFGTEAGLPLPLVTDIYVGSLPNTVSSYPSVHGPHDSAEVFQDISVCVHNTHHMGCCSTCVSAFSHMPF